MTDPRAPAELPPDYYWRNFRALIDEVLEHHSHLLLKDERRRIDGLLGLPKDAQRLFVRLLGRKGDLFRRSKLAYSEIGDLDGGIASLRETRLLEVNPLSCFEDGSALSTLTVPELKDGLARLGIRAKGRKAELVAALESQDCAGWLAEVDSFLLLRNTAPFEIAKVLFFGNRHQDLTEFVLSDLAISTYADYRVSRDRPLFSDREDLEAYLLASEREDACHQAQAEGDTDAVVAFGDDALHDLSRRASSGRFMPVVDPARCDERVVFMAARELERQGDRATAIRTYEALLQHGRSIRRAARVVDRLGLALGREGRAEELRQHAEAVLASDRLDDVSRHVVELRLHRAKLAPNPRAKLRRPVEERVALRAAGHQGPKALYLDNTGEPATVEMAVLSALGGDGFWCEGSLYTTLFGVLFWEEIFAPVEGVFQHRFQDAPLDMESEWFFTNRRGAIEARLKACAGDGVVGATERAYAFHAGLRCRGVAWDAYEARDLVRAVKALGPALVPILGRLARSPHVHRAGLPDLFLFADGGAKLIEVKGPGDQVSVEQALWHDALIAAGADVRLVRVERIG